MSIPNYKFIRAFKDREKKILITSLKSEDFVRAGSSSKPFYIYVVNVTAYELMDVTIYCNEPDVEITPSQIPYMKAGETKQVKVVWSPSLKREEALSTPIYARARLIKRARRVK